MKNSLVLVTLFLNSCFHSPKSKSVDLNHNLADLKREWMMIAFRNYSKEMLIENKANLNLTEKESASAYMGCNQLSFPYSYSDSKLVFRGGIMTEMACPNMDSETQFAESLVKVRSYKTEGHFLSLYTQNGDTMKFIASDWD